MEKKSNKNKVHQVYKLQTGETVAGVTTILGILDKPALIKWAWQCGIDGIDFDKIRQTAATIGTIAHYLCECYLKETIPDLDNYSKNDINKAETSYLAFLDFIKNNKLKVILQEKQLVHEQLHYGGTCDIYAQTEDGKFVLIDIKTSKGIYPEMRLQLAAYKELLVVNGYPVDKVELIRIDKESGEFSHYKFEDLTEEFEMFKLLINVYKLKKAIWKKG